jgi:hypothetical protein
VLFELGITLGFLCLGAIGCGLSAIALRQRRPRCPSCQAPALDTYNVIRATVVDDAGKPCPAWWTLHRCSECAAGYVRYNGGGLITEEAFQAGAREPPPVATVVRSDRA